MNDLFEEIRSILFGSNDLERVFLYKNKVIAIDFQFGSIFISFDLTPDFINNFIKIEIFSRKDDSYISVLGFEKSSNGKFFIGNFKLESLRECMDVVDSYKNKLKDFYSGEIRNGQDLNDEFLVKYDLEEGLKENEVKSNLGLNRYGFNLIDVLNKDICIGCGACNIITEGKVGIYRNDLGIYQANFFDVINLSSSDFYLANEVCPFTNISLNENELDIPNKKYYNLPHNEIVGKYSAIFSARRSNEEELEESSSGGMTSWLIRSLFYRDKIDAVIHVGNNVNSANNDIFSYKISYSIEESESNKKSAYYSITLSEVIYELKSNKKLRYAVVGLPCFIKSLRLLSEKDAILKSSILYYIGLVCGHLKSSFFAESNAWQLGVHPGDINSVDFRVKNKNKLASQYDFSVSSKNSIKKINKRSSSLVGGSWGFGFFQPNACNYCDDIFAETADVVFADAWLPEFSKNGLGTNLVVSRNRELDEIFEDGVKKDEIKFQNLSIEDAIKSQAGGIRHRREGLKIRLYQDLSFSKATPDKRVKPSINNIPSWRVDLINHRQKISKLSLELFKKTKEEGNLQFFLNKMQSEIDLYKYINNSRYPVVKKKKYYDVALFGWHSNRNLGGSLTVFALHQLLKENGLSVVVVPKPGSLKVKDGNRNNLAVINKYYKYARERSFDDLHQLRNYCDTFVLASDQLWAGKWIKFQPEFEFLACGDESVKKISVATSFGGDGFNLPFEDSKKTIVSHYLEKIDFISVREPSGVDILKKIGLKSEQILDPVFLCSDSTYDLLISESEVKNKENYIFGYMLDFDENLILSLKKDVEKEIKISSNIFTTTMSNDLDNNNILIDRWNNVEGIDFYSYPSLADFVKLIYNSSFVITDSFHGACLCVIFNKPFLCLPRGSRGNSRFALFDQLGLGDRIIKRNKIDTRAIKKEIKWNEVNLKLEKMRNDSLLWLSKSFSIYMKR